MNFLLCIAFVFDAYTFIQHIETGLGINVIQRRLFNHFPPHCDVKLYARNYKRIETLLQKVYRFTRITDVQFRLEK